MSEADVTVPAEELTITGDQVFGAETGRIRAVSQVRVNVFFRPVREGMFRGTIEWREGGAVIWQEAATGTGTP